MAQHSLAKMGTLTRFILRIDRMRIILWLIGLTFFTLVVPNAFNGLYESQQERDGMADTMKNPAMTAMVGPGDLENYTVGAMTTHQMLLMTALVAGLMSILLMTLHTRLDEEDGRVEMIRSLPAGRLSYLNASILMLIGICLTLSLVTGIGLYILGIDSMNLEGSLLYGAGLGGTGLVFAGVTAIFAQLSESSRGTIGLSVAILLFTYLFRAVTDISNEALSWLSPLGWVTKTEAYSANNWSPVLLMIGISLLLFIFANYLHSIRDLERGFLPSKPGKKHASRFLLSPLGLAFRLQRTGMFCWALGIFVVGASYGSVLGDMESFFEGNEMMQQMLQPTADVSLTEQFIPMLIIIIAIISAVPTIMAMTKLRGEENKDRIEHLLGRAVSRPRLLGGYLLLSLIVGFVMLSLSALGLWGASATVMEDGFELWTIYEAVLAYYPALFTMIGLTVFLIGLFPKLTAMIWVYLVYSFFVLYLGGLMQFPEWIGNLSPFGHIPQAPLEDITFLPLFLLNAVSVVLIILGFIGFRKRDLESQ
ncbi:ABC-2 type transport system permease protein [Halobacillus karajensis]|uniref:ABC-type transport system involved in multi-copper enzyme maturation, permease component n=1 Tax=Halobacillus karajensis TaxID=195088 RepID=A0A024P636_9BACI|nr:ABC-2 transporter permease [Halobacillus karajensis]CDQ18173.1 ABC-type transport system involved in multi-copper enzyme maturation, permease component [Halobacillus karajensis]CDQ24524.1 ABC-type transport system involved in multi-copper enzyme maturation, permease component [Halobacillus karajensis]CDQ29228.1 ABC-type transport system involved in multi-copper enzyme maturation, permease component [Halobacillus karajensis]SEH57883.1 ABC-2 type transport system permease protein [Halobacillus